MLKLINSRRSIELAHKTHVFQFTLHFLLFLSFYNINIFRKKFAAQLSAVDSHVLHIYEFDVETMRNHRAKKLSKKIYDIASIIYFLIFAPTLDNFKSFQWTRNLGIEYANARGCDEADAE